MIDMIVVSLGSYYRFKRFVKVDVCFLVFKFIAFDAGRKRAVGS